MKTTEKFILLGFLVSMLIIFAEFRYNETAEINYLLRGELQEQKYETDKKLTKLECKIKGGEWKPSEHEAYSEYIIFPRYMRYGTCVKDGVEYFYQDEGWVTLELIK